MTDQITPTGLAGLVVTAAVTEPVHEAPETHSHTELIPAPVNQPAVSPMPDGWTIQRVAALVRDLAMNMYDLPYILAKHNLTAEQHAYLEKNEFFKRAVEMAVLEWNSPHSTQKRLAMEAAIALEDALPTMAARLSKPTEQLAGVVALASLFTKIAGIGENTPTQNIGEKFKITINLGADVFEREKAIAPKVVMDLQSFPQGAGADTSLQRLIGQT